LKKTQLGWVAKALNIMDSQSLVHIVARNISFFSNRTACD